MSDPSLCPACGHTHLECHAAEPCDGLAHEPHESHHDIGESGA